MSDEKDFAAQQPEEENFAAMFEASQEENSQVRPQVGQKVTGKVIDLTDDSVFVNIGAKIDGVMDR